MAEHRTLIERPPIVVVMGHVDHGKSTLLDYIRKSNVVAGEAGGITQHVAAYEVSHPHEGREKRITFIDTPGHAAFTAIRARGANVADIAILVVAADDGVKAQTLEALRSIRASDTPFIVAINKIDKPNADPERTRYSLLEHEVYLEGLGGDVPWVAISAKTGAGVPELLDLILIAAELEELKADPAQCAQGYVIEASRDEKRGIGATLIITDGTLETGMALSAGTAIAPVRRIDDHLGTSLTAASFSTPVRVFGFDTLPAVGTAFTACDTKKEAEALSREAHAKAEAAAAVSFKEGTFVLPVVVKADAAGSLEAIVGEIEKIGDEEARVRVVGSGIGDITEGDVKTAAASPEGGALVIGFTVGADRMASELARQCGIELHHFDIIYRLTESLTELLATRKPKRTELITIATARVLKHFSSRHDEHLVGGKVESGTFEKKARLVVMRKGEKIGRGEVVTLQVARQDVQKVETGNEFGALVACDAELQGGDVLEAVRETER